MDWKLIAGRAKQVVEKRGGTESVKQDAEELRNIAQGEGTVSEKLGRAAKAIKEPGTPPASSPGADSPQP